MKTYIAFLRGINVGGQKKVPMAELRKILDKAGLVEVKTYIQSGNVIFKSDQNNEKILAEKISGSIKDHFGFQVPVLVKTPSEIKSILDSCPFPPDKMERSYFTLLYHEIHDEAKHILSHFNFENEEIYPSEMCIYFFSDTGYGKAKFNNNFIENKLKLKATTRNYRTMMKLLSLSDQ